MAKWGRPGQGKAILKAIINRDFVRVGNVYFPPNSSEALVSRPAIKKRTKTVKTGWIDDTRNLKNKEKYNDQFMQLIKMELGLEVWPEFYFSTERMYRLDYAIPEHKLGIEVNGGIWAKGNSGHSSGTGIIRDYEKSNLAQSLGWRILTVTPSQVGSCDAIKILKTYL